MVRPKLGDTFSNGTMALPMGHGYRIMQATAQQNAQVELVAKPMPGLEMMMSWSVWVPAVCSSDLLWGH